MHFCQCHNCTASKKHLLLLQKIDFKSKWLEKEVVISEWWICWIKNGDSWKSLSLSRWRWPANSFVLFLTLYFVGLNLNKIMYTMSQKPDTDVGCYSLMYSCTSTDFDIFYKNFDERVSCWLFIFSPHLSSVSALPGETWIPQIATFYVNTVYCFAHKHANQLKTCSDYHVVTAKPLFIQKTINCAHQTKSRKSA